MKPNNQCFNALEHNLFQRLAAIYLSNLDQNEKVTWKRPHTLKVQTKCLSVEYSLIALTDAIKLFWIESKNVLGLPKGMISSKKCSSSLIA